MSILDKYYYLLMRREKISQPYTYRIKFKPTGEYYYGVRYAKNCRPSDLWVTYFTSSTKVKKLINEFGRESFDIEIRRVFETKEQAIQWEERITKRVIHWPNYLNVCSGRAFNHSKSINGGVVAATKGVGIHSMTPQEKSEAGKKGGMTLSKRKKEIGLTENEKQGIIRGHEKISQRRQSGNWTEKELNANRQMNERKLSGNWTENEMLGYKRLTERRRAGNWTEQELSGFAKVSAVRKSGKWITDGNHNKFISGIPPDGWQYGFVRKKRET